MKRVRLCSTVPNYHRLMYTTLFAGKVFYGKSNRHSAVLFMNGESPTKGIIKYIFGHSNRKALYSLVLINVLDQMEPEAGDCAVVNAYDILIFQYSISQSGYMRTVRVDNVKQIRAMIMGVDHYLLKYSFGIQVVFTDINDSIVPRSNI